MILIDTHIWFWLLLENGPISKSVRSHFKQLSIDRKLCLSAISIWEASYLMRKGRIKVSMPFDHWIRSATSSDVVKVLPVSTEVIIEEHLLPESMHGDPADRIIVATALAFNCELATVDKNLRSLRRVKYYTRKLD